MQGMPSLLDPPGVDIHLIAADETLLPLKHLYEEIIAVVPDLVDPEGLLCQNLGMLVFQSKSKHPHIGRQ